MSISLIIFSVSFFALTGPFMELRRVFVCTLPKPTIFWVGDFAAFRAGVLLPLFCSFGTYIRRRREGSKWHSIIMSVNDERAMRMRIQFAISYWLCDSVRGEFWLRERIAFSVEDKKYSRISLLCRSITTAQTCLLQLCMLKNWIYFLEFLFYIFYPPRTRVVNTVVRKGGQREGDGGSRAIKYLLHLELAFILRRLFKVAGLHLMEECYLDSP